MPKHYISIKNSACTPVKNSSKKGIFSTVLLLLLATISGNANRVSAAIPIAIPTSSDAVALKTTTQPLWFPEMDHTTTAHFYTYIYNPLFFHQNKGDCPASLLRILPPLWCNWIRVPIIQNNKMASPTINITHLIQIT